MSAKKKHAAKTPKQKEEAAAPAKPEPVTMFNSAHMPQKPPVEPSPTPSQFAAMPKPLEAPEPMASYIKPTNVAEACIRLSQEIDPNIRAASSKELAAMFHRLGELFAQVK